MTQASSATKQYPAALDQARVFCRSTGHREASRPAEYDSGMGPATSSGVPVDAERGHVERPCRLDAFGPRSSPRMPGTFAGARPTYHQ